MDTGKDIKIIRNVPEPARVPEEEPKPIAVPDWPVKEPAKEPEKVGAE